MDRVGSRGSLRLIDVAATDAVLGRRDGGTLAGHLEAGEVRPTLECVMTESPAHLHKRFDPESGLALIHPAR